MAQEMIVGPLPAQTAAGADSTTRLGMVPYKYGEPNWTAEKITVIPTAALTADNTNNLTLTVQRNRAGTTATIGALTTTVASGNWVNATPVDVPISAGRDSLQAGDVVQVLMHQNGAGVAVTIGAFVTVEID